MRILYWPPLFLPDIGGIETLSARLVPELQRRGHEIVVVTSHGRHKVPDTIHFGDIPVHRFNFRQTISSNSLPQIVRIRRSISELKRQFKPEVIHFHISDPSIYFHMSTRKAHPAPLLLSLHGRHSHIYQKHQQHSLYKRTLQEADWVTCVSETTLTESQKLTPSIKSRSSVVYNGLEPLNQPPRPLSFDPPHILCPARLIPEKALHLAIDAFTAIRERFPHAIMSIAGDGVLRGELEQQVIELGLENIVRFLGEVRPEEMPHYLDAATVVLLSSDTEGLPMTLLEAGQMARPVVSTDVGGVAEAVVHNKTGILVEPGSSSKLASAVIGLLSQPEKTQQMGDAARQFIQEKFSLSTCADAYEQLYVQLAAQYDSSMNE